MLKLEGHANLRKFTTSNGTVYCIGGKGRRAWPLWGPVGPRGTYTPDDADARGEEVDRDMPGESYAVTHAGGDWREVYDHLRARAGSCATTPREEQVDV